MLFAVRHGQTDWNLAGRAQGQANRPLTDIGRQQAAKSAELIKRCAIPSGFDPASLPIFTSPLDRALETARIINEALGSVFPAVVDGRLTELSFGNWEGMTPAEMKADDPVRRRARKNDRWSVAPPGGESYADLDLRVGNFLSSVGEPAIIVTHLGVLRLMAMHCARNDRDVALAMKFRNDAVYVFGKGELEVFQD